MPDPPCRHLRRARRLACALAGWPRRPWPRTRRRCCASSFSIAESSFDPQFSSDAAVRCDHPQHLRGDARLRLPRAPGAARAADARSDADGAGRRRDLHLPLEEGHLLHAGPGVQGQAARAHRCRSRLRHQAPARPGGQSPWRWLVDGKIVGASEARAKAAKTGRFDYDAPIAGLEVVDRYTLRIRLDAARSALSLCACGAEHGAPWRARSSRRTGSTSARIRWAPAPTCLANTSAARRSCSSPNPGYRETTYVPAGPVPRGVAAGRGGAQGQEAARSPARIEANVIEEGQAQWLAFAQPRGRPPRTAAVRRSSTRRWPTAS